MKVLVVIFVVLIAPLDAQRLQRSRCEIQELVALGSFRPATLSTLFEAVVVVVVMVMVVMVVMVAAVVLMRTGTLAAELSAKLSTEWTAELSTELSHRSGALIIIEREHPDC